MVTGTTTSVLFRGCRQKGASPEMIEENLLDVVSGSTKLFCGGSQYGASAAQTKPTTGAVHDASPRRDRQNQNGMREVRPAAHSGHRRPYVALYLATPAGAENGFNWNGFRYVGTLKDLDLMARARRRHEQLKARHGGGANGRMTWGWAGVERGASADGSTWGWICHRGTRTGPGCSLS